MLKRTGKNGMVRRDVTTIMFSLHAWNLIKASLVVMVGYAQNGSKGCKSVALWSALCIFLGRASDQIVLKPGIGSLCRPQFAGSLGIHTFSMTPRLAPPLEMCMVLSGPYFSGPKA